MGKLKKKKSYFWLQSDIQCSSLAQCFMDIQP